MSLAYRVALFILQGVSRMEKKCKTENQMTKVVCISWLWQKFCRSLARFAFHLVYLFLYFPPHLPFALLFPFRCPYLSLWLGFLPWLSISLLFLGIFSLVFIYCLPLAYAVN